jgi:hypothetical protein
VGEAFLGDTQEAFVQTSRLADNGPGPLPPGFSDAGAGTRLARGDFDDWHELAGYRLAWKAKETQSFIFNRS